MTNVPDEHRKYAPKHVNCAVVTISDTRTVSTDMGGSTAVELLQSAGHRVVARELLPDEREPLAALLHALCQRDDIEAVLLTGGTGLGSRDQTYETLTHLLDKPLPGYGELFRMLSFREIGPAAMLSRAAGGVLAQTVVLSMPGSPAAVRLAMEELILPELGHLVREARR
ncbi:MAG: molybdenum cofactor biosynthesis protein B [Thermoguttaceae bacterium]|jgi:molybdenum cofactor biosynthesis protein B|nr:molybdenum cofactor biosynthesis protein B [Thermoguttaceae bacterium]